MKTKLFTLILALVASVDIVFAEKVQIGDLYYELIDWGDTKFAIVTYEEYSSTNNYANLAVANIPETVEYKGIIYNVTEIGYHAFDGCPILTTATIPNSVTKIEDAAFYSCWSLTSVTIGSGITYIGGEAFANNPYLTEVTIEAITPPTLRSDYSNYVFDYVKSFYVPCGSIDAYKSAPYWSDHYKDYIKYRTSLYEITPLKTNGGSISIPENLTVCDVFVQLNAVPDRGCYFVKWADGNTDNPRTIELTQDTTMEAIFDCLLSGKCGENNALTWTLDTTIMALNIAGQGALSENFTYGTFIKSLTIGNEVTSIGKGAFEEYKNLKSIVLGASVKVLEISAFEDCIAVEAITCYSQRPPTVKDEALDGVAYSTIVYVPAEYLNTYQMHDAWGLYDVRPLGATPTNTDDVKVEPTETTAVVVWPAISGAASYELVIKDKKGNVVCTLVFNEKGQLTSIVYNAPGRRSPSQTQADGFSFTVTGLDSNTSYDLTITAKNSSGATLSQKNTSFKTAGVSAIDQISNNQLPMSNKVIRNGQLYILRDGKTYTVQGQEVK
jgi:hypothetical protein